MVHLSEATRRKWYTRSRLDPIAKKEAVTGFEEHPVLDVETSNRATHKHQRHQQRDHPGFPLPAMKEGMHDLRSAFRRLWNRCRENLRILDVELGEATGAADASPERVDDWIFEDPSIGPVVCHG